MGAFRRLLMYVFVCVSASIVLALLIDPSTDPIRVRQFFFYYVKEDPIRAAFGGWFSSCGNPCVVTYNKGGPIAIFEEAAHAIRNSDTLLIIDGACKSACAIAADQARDHVCITKKAAFSFHKAYIVGRIRFDPTQSPDIDTWVKDRGGYPTGSFLTMLYEDAKRFWKTCPPQL